ncbi:MAG: hypothetical protein J0I06_05080 [Planctomycetes bacterium]|nr:hypothetical protein [Planctomycetota bacterium]
MGLDRTIRFPAGAVPAWDAIKGQLARVGEPAPLRMIDGLPAFPDESPEEGWRELRVGVAAGMVTVRRGPDSLTCVVWSNADPALLAARDLIAWACASAGPGIVDTAAGAVPADEFARNCGISPA